MRFVRTPPHEFPSTNHAAHRSAARNMRPAGGFVHAVSARDPVLLQRRVLTMERALWARRCDTTIVSQGRFVPDRAGASYHEGDGTVGIPCRASLAGARLNRPRRLIDLTTKLKTATTATPVDRRCHPATGEKMCIDKPVEEHAASKLHAQTPLCDTTGG